MSALPRTSYRGPKLDVVGVLQPDGTVGVDVNTTSALPTAGGGVLVFKGDYFGPVAPSLLIVAVGVRGVGLGPSSSESGAAVSTSSCSVVGSGHAEVWCTSPPGTGTGYRWYLAIAGQRTALAPQVTAYGTPRVTGARTTLDGRDALLNVSTAGGEALTLTGTNFGAALGTISVTWAGAPVPEVRLREPHTTLSLSSLPGPGGAVPLVLTVDGQVTRVSLHYGAPRVDGVRLDRGGAGSTLDCSLVGADGRPEGGAPPGAAAALVITGTNFGDGTNTTVTVGGVPCDAQGAEATHTRIVCRTPMCEGACVVAVALVYGC
jgi:hypothetical protein